MAVEISASMQSQPVFVRSQIRLGAAVIPFRSLGLKGIRVVSVRVNVPRAKAPWLCRVNGEGHVVQVEHTHSNGFL